MTPEMQNALNQLNDIALPPAIGWWPLAFSWWILLLSVTSILIGIAWYIREQRRRNAYRKQALSQLEQIMHSPQSDSEKIQHINRLLKQVALTAYGRARVAQLQQTQWLQFLKHNANYIQQPERLGHAVLLGYGPQQEAKQELTLFYQYAKRWIKGHHQ